MYYNIATIIEINLKNKANISNIPRKVYGRAKIKLCAHSKVN